MINSTYRFLTTAPRKRAYNRRRHLRSPHDLTRTLCGSVIGLELTPHDLGTHGFMAECQVCTAAGKRGTRAA